MTSVRRLARQIEERSTMCVDAARRPSLECPLVLLRNLIPSLLHKAFSGFRITHYNNNQPNFYTEKVGSVFVVNARLIKIEIDRLSIIQTLKEHILRMFKDAVLSGIAKSALKRSLKHVEKN